MRAKTIVQPKHRNHYSHLIKLQ